MNTTYLQDTAYDTAIALVGMSGRFPGASNVEAFWHNLAAGVASIRVFSAEELLAAGIDPTLLAQPNYVKAGTVLEGIADFDASFFGYTPREAQVMDPQHRLFLECCWEALERAAYDPRSYAGLIGVFAGSAFSYYLLHNLYPNAQLRETVGQLQMDVGNERDSLASMVSYKLNLRGPSLAVQTFCSTSLVAVHLASQSLLNYECDLALAGGVAFGIPQPQGYLYETGGILSPDGHCRSFDAHAQGSVMGSGVGVVVLKRLREALHDGDNILAVLRGSAINNDGSTRVSYTAPGVEGQASVIAAALSYAGVAPESISYIETHGTATPLGDAVEVAAMKKVFGASSADGPWCALGSLKPNVGHLDRASGVTGLIKTALALSHEQLPPNLDYEHSSPALALEQSPFHVNTQLQAWPRNGRPRRAGVSSFGLGGTNAHVVLEEAPVCEGGSASRPWHLLLLSARSASALEAASDNLLRHLQEHPALELADVAYTLQVGRSAFHQRRMLVCQNRDDAIAALSTADAGRIYNASLSHRDRSVNFLFSGSLTPISGQIKEIYEAELTFREAVDRCCSLIQPMLKRDLREVLFTEEITRQPDNVTQLALFIVEYALAQLLISWGIRPKAMLGVGSGEYVAACLSGVLTLEDALRIVASLVQARSVSPENTAEQLKVTLRDISLNAPQIPYISNVTGTWITTEQATIAVYWNQHLVETGHTADGIAQLLHESESVLLEVGLDHHLSDLVKQHPAFEERHAALLLPLFAERGETSSAEASLLNCLGHLWLCGVTVDWAGLYIHERRLRVLLPTYPFERQRYWIETAQEQAAARKQCAQPAGQKKSDIADWFYLPSWVQIPLQVKPVQQPTSWLVFIDETGLGEQIAVSLSHAGSHIVRVHPGAQFAQLDSANFVIRPAERADYTALLNVLANTKSIPDNILHSWSVTAHMSSQADASYFQHIQNLGLYSLLFLKQALGEVARDQAMQIVVLSNRVHAVVSGEEIQPEKATILGLCKVISQEHMHVICRSIDVEVGSRVQQTALIAQLLPELTSPSSERVVAYRDSVRWIQTYEPVHLEHTDESAICLRQNGVYLIIGGLGGVGPVLAEYLFQTVQARLAFIGRTSLPPREQWTLWLAQHEATNAISQKIQQVQSLEAAGAEVLVLQADVAVENQLRQATEQVRKHFGALHGVIHAAAISQSEAFGSVQTIDRGTCEWHFQPKVYGLYALERVLQDVPLDFCVLFSSVSSVLGGLGFTGYVAANMFMDAFTHKHNQTYTTPWLSINWDTWSIRPEGHAGLGGSVAMYAMSREEGLKAFERLLACNGLNQVVISTGDIQERIRQWILLENMQDDLDTAYEPGRVGQKAFGISGVPSREEYERNLAAIWQQVLGVEEVGLYDNFFDLGGNSLSALQVIAKIHKVFGTQVSVVALFEAPTISAMAQYLQPQPTNVEQEQVDELAQRRDKARQEIGQQDIAIIGMSGRFPGAADIEQFWHNLREGVESISFFSEEELLAAGVDPAEVHMPNYVKARPILPAGMVEEFDAAFFGYNPREAELMDPQHRLFLTCSWEALEHAGYDPFTYSGLVGVYGGANISSYLHSLLKQPELLASLQGVVNEYQAVIGMDKDSLATGVSYKLNLRGPSFAVQTFCSTSLVAVHLASQALRAGECDMALAGGVSVRIPYKTGHLYEQGGMESADGHCRTFDAQAHGTMVGDGAGIVVLKRLSDAVRDGDTIHAVLKGTAINNDGSLKVSYSAPGVIGQADVVSSALANAGISAESIDYIEAHGTATEIGDPIEVASLTKAFRKHTDKRGYCAIGSVKTNIGHLDRAAGVSGLIKTVLALKHEELPASLHYVSPNPQIDFEDSPFYVNAQLAPWKRNGRPRRAGISSLGMGGTNAHVIIEEAPERTPSSPSRSWQLLPLSAKTASALEMSAIQLHTYLQEHDEIQLADAAYTLQIGRSQFNHRKFVLAQDRTQAISLLETSDTRNVFSAFDTHRDRQVAFLFPGVGEQFISLTQELYQQEAMFRESIDYCFTFLKEHLKLDLKSLLYPETLVEQAQYSNGNGNGKVHPAGLDLRALLGRNGATASTPATERLKQTAITQPLVFAIEYALAQLLMHWGLRPQAMLGYSLGEYVAACLAGVFSLEDALTLVTRRAQLIQQLPEGAMLAVALSEESVEQYLDDQISLAAINGPETSVLAGPVEDIEWLQEQFADYGIICRRIETSHAFHSSMLEPIREALTELAGTVKLHAPRIPYISNVTGTWITPEQATDPAHWASHMCETVRFADGIGHMLQETGLVLVEVGPGQSLGSYVKQHPACSSDRIHLVLPTLPSLHDKQSEQAFILTTLGKLWLAGVPVDWQQFCAAEQRWRIPLPTYPFERQRYWLEAPKASSQPRHSARGKQGKISNISEWFYLPTWEQAPLPPAEERLQDEIRNWLIFEDATGLGQQLAQKLASAGHHVVRVQQGSQFSQQDDTLFTLRAGERTDYVALCKALSQSGQMPRSVLHCWSVTQAQEPDTEVCFSQCQEQGFYSLLFLVQAMGEIVYEEPVQVVVLSTTMQALTSQEIIHPEKATILGACKVIPQEQLNIVCRSIDLALPAPESRAYDHMVAVLIEECSLAILDPIVIYRHRQRWIQTFKPVVLEQPGGNVFRQQGVYLITGGLGGVGLVLAEHLARTRQARLVLTARSGLPAKAYWNAWLEKHDADDSVSLKIQRLLHIEQVGGEVLVMQADVTDVQQMKGVISQAYELFGGLNGVIHAAGITSEDAFRVIQEIDREECEQHFQPKVYGLLALEQALQDHELDFCLLFSSISTVLGGLSYLGYAAANTFMDAYTDKHNRTADTPWICVNWDTWQTKDKGHQRATTVSEYVMSPTEGIAALTRIIASTMSHVINSTGDLHARIKQWIRLEALDSASEAGQQSDASILLGAARPNLATPYMAARDDYEQKIVEIWQRVLGIGQIGIHDNFFELGGHSLIGTQLISRLRHTFQVNLPLVMLFEAPTVAELSLAIKMTLLEEIDRLDEEEVQRLI